MSTNFEDIQNGQVPQAGPLQPSAVPQTQPQSGYYPGDPGTDIAQPGQPQPQGSSPFQPPQPPPISPREQRLKMYSDLITNFTFSLGSGVSASAQAPGGARNRTMAGVGAALQAPQWLEELKQKQALQQAQLQETLQKSKMVPAINPQTGLPITGADGQPLMIPANQAGTDYTRQFGIQTQADTSAKTAADREAAQTARENAAKLKRADDLAKQGLKEDATGSIVPMGRNEMSPVLQQKMDDAEKLNALRNAQADAATARADYDKLKNDPNSFISKQAKERLDIAEGQLKVAQDSLGIRNQELDLRKEAAANNTPQAKLAAGLYKDASAAGISYNSLQGLVNETRKNPASASVNDNAMLDQFYNIVKPDKGGRFTIAERTGIKNVGTLEERAQVWGQQLTNRGSFTDQTRQELLDAAKIVLDAKQRGAGAASPARNAPAALNDTPSRTPAPGSRTKEKINGRWMEVTIGPDGQKTMIPIMSTR